MNFVIQKIRVGPRNMIIISNVVVLRLELLINYLPLCQDQDISFNGN